MTRIKKIQNIILLSMGIMGIYGFPNMKAAFYNIMKGAFILSDMQLSKIWTVYGLVTLCSYIFGGCLTDRISPKKIIVVALSVSGILHFYLSFIPEYSSILVVSAMMGVTTVLAFFPAASKILSTMNKDGNAGNIFGIYYALEGVGNTLLNFLGTGLYTFTEDSRVTFMFMMRAYTILNFISAIFIFFFLKEKKVIEEKGSKVSITGIGRIIKKKEVWLISIIMLSTYVMFCSMAYINAYLKEIYKIPEQINLFLAVIRVDIIAIIAGVLFGKFCNKRGSVAYVVQRGLLIAVASIILILINQFTLHSPVLTIAFTMVFSFVGIGAKTVSIAMVAQQKFPISITGSVIGIVSFIGYSPDAFLYPVIGEILTKSGNSGYTYMFALYLLVAVIGSVCCIILEKNKESIDKSIYE